MDELKPDLTVKEFSQIINTSEKTVRRMGKRGDLVMYRSGRTIRIPHDELARFRERNRVIAEPGAVA
ncbi:helix-turn-helix domain-containing protein [Aestuariirhabdus sp. Z084]|uniref:helix-turn-helix domain-containing protein n=1 Tax=Aestuariirhabdus haliotis TaxID=2918751 RepID=UPI00201B35F2|nr:helix-turn-helix domain-containing protein [Aestuariirhabdus haliotis]MCL6416350.1 helix-turn-helix domain-containing protein [Aestuariirhabdus haliotis]MCL6420339.1 helix-turn-helix domain-containing protein [Aestuariirhabdus haliotis]